MALQVQTIPSQILKLTCPTSGLKFSPLVAIEPRRRRFHNPIEVAIPLSAAKDPSRVRLLCSLAANSTPKALFEDVTEMTPITLSKGKKKIPFLLFLKGKNKNNTVCLCSLLSVALVGTHRKFNQ